MMFDDIESFEVEEGFLPFLHLLTLHAKLEKDHASKPVSLPDAAGEGVHDEAPLTLKMAAKLPECLAISVKQLRGAIARGELPARQPGGSGGTVYVTRADIKHWISKWSDAPSRHISGCAQQNTSKEGSEPAQSGASSMDRKRSALAAALKTARRLKDG